VVARLRLRLAPRVGLDLQLELAAGGDLALQLELVALLPFGGLVLPFGDLPAVPRGDERAGERGPQAGDDAQPHVLEVVAQHEHGGGHDGEHNGCDE